MTPTAEGLPWASHWRSRHVHPGREHETSTARLDSNELRASPRAAMTEVWLRAALWLGLALAATLISIRLRVAPALSEIVETQAAIELATRHDEILFDGLRRQAQERNVTLETYVLVGHPA